MPSKRAPKKPTPASSLVDRALDTDDDNADEEQPLDLARELRAMEESLRGSVAVNVS